MSSSFSCYTSPGEVRFEDRYTDATDLDGERMDQEDCLTSESWERELGQRKVLEDRDYERKLGEKPALMQRIGLRVFISHRQSDEAKARAIAKHLKANDIAYWLDVLDARLSSPSKPALAVANIIEIALLNCTHVLALMTDNSSGSAWIPYEYGRVKERRLQVENAAAFRHKLTTPLPEYMLLGKVHETNAEMIGWLKGP